MPPLTFRATITVEVTASTRREAERKVLGVVEAIHDTMQETDVKPTFPLPEPKVVTPSTLH